MMHHERYDDRIQAGKLLAERLEEYRGRNPLVLAIPRGAVPMAKAVSDCLEGELDVVLVHKLSVGRFYRDFSQVEDEDVMRILAQAGAGKIHHDHA